MNKNMSNTDRIGRIALSILFVALYFTGVTSGTIGIVLLVLGGVFVLTSFMGSCPIYSLVGISTCAVSTEK